MCSAPAAGQGGLVNDSSEVHLMKRNTNESTTPGTPELALLLFAVAAMFAYVLV